METLKLEDLNYTYKDYKLREGNWELASGVSVAMSPLSTSKYQSLASEIIFHLHAQLEDCPMCEVFGEIDYKINENSILEKTTCLHLS